MSHRSSIDSVISRKTCMRYIVKYVTEGYCGRHHMDYTIYPIEGDLVVGEVEHPHRDYNVVEFIVPYSKDHNLAGAWSPSQVFESRQEAENAANERLRKTHTELTEMLGRVKLR